MKIIILVIADATQAKLILKQNTVIIKIPGKLTVELQKEVRNKLLKIADIHAGKAEFLSMYYKVGTPFMFLNKKVRDRRRETAFVYKYNEL